jgi:hypothetical protein
MTRTKQSLTRKSNKTQQRTSKSSVRIGRAIQKKKEDEEKILRERLQGVDEVVVQRIINDDERRENHHRRLGTLVGKTPADKQSCNVAYLENVAADEAVVRHMLSPDGTCKIILMDYHKGGFPSYYHYDPTPSDDQPRRRVLGAAYVGMLAYLKRQCSETYPEHLVLFEQLLGLTYVMDDDVSDEQFFFESSAALLEKYLGLRFSTRKEFADAFGTLKQIGCEDLPRYSPSIMFEFSSR